MQQAPAAQGAARPDGVGAAPADRRARAATPFAAPTGRKPGIDALNGLGMLFVILQHAAIRLPVEPGALAARLPGWPVADLFVVIAIPAAFTAAGASATSCAWRIVPMLAGASARGARVARVVSVPAARRRAAAGHARPDADAGRAAAGVPA